MVKAIVTGLEQDREHRLLPALGKTPEDAKASRAPYNASGQALPYLDRVGRGARTVSLRASGLLDMLPDEQKSYGDSALFEFSNLKGALARRRPGPRSRARRSAASLKAHLRDDRARQPA